MGQIAEYFSIALEYGHLEITSFLVRDCYQRSIPYNNFFMLQFSRVLGMAFDEAVVKGKITLAKSIFNFEITVKKVGTICINHENIYYPYLFMQAFHEKNIAMIDLLISFSKKPIANLILCAQKASNDIRPLVINKIKQLLPGLCTFRHRLFGQYNNE